MGERRAPFLIAMRCKAATILMFVWAVASVFAAEPKLQDCENPIWSRDVLAELSRPQESISRFPDTNRAGVVFLSSDEIIVYEVDLDTTQLSSRIGPEVSSPFRLRLSLLNSATGKLELTKAQGTRAHDSAVYATTGGVLVKTGDLLKLYSTDLT